MNISRSWLQKYFEDALPEVAVIADALTFHSCEIEAQAGDMLDVKVLPDRASYALSHRGIALEVSASLRIPLKEDPLRTSLPEYKTTDNLVVSADERFVLQHTGALLEGVKVGESPKWLKDALESVGQRSINNIVDATNYVMLDIGQPLHAFDADTISHEDGVTRIRIREAHEGEEVSVLTGETYTLLPEMFVIADDVSGAALDIAGVKGGSASGITESTTRLFISVGTYDGALVRRMSKNLKLWTDASARYQNNLSPELAAYGMRDIISLIQKLAGGELIGVVRSEGARATESLSPVTVTLSKIKSVLGSPLTAEDVAEALENIQLPFIEEGETFIVTPTFDRRDIVIPEDVIEEVGRIIGYDHIPSTPLEALSVPADQTRFYGIESIKDFLVERGYVELSTQSFAREGAIKLMNPFQQERPWLRSSLMPNMEESLTRTVQVAPRILGPESSVKLFEIGSIFSSSEESLVLVLGVRVLEGKGSVALDALKEHVATLQQEILRTPVSVAWSLDGSIAQIPLGGVDLESLTTEAPKQISVQSYAPFSVYPHALRDIAVWVAEGTEQSEVSLTILEHAGEYLARIDCFDKFEKDGRISYAFRLVFESKERTLTDKDLDPAMRAITQALGDKPGYQVR